MTTLATDDFNRANSTDDLGANYTALYNHTECSIVSNTCRPSDNGVAHASLYTGVGAIANDQWAQITISAFTTDDGNGLIVRGSTSVETYAQTFYFGSDWYIEVYNSGSLVNSTSGTGTTAPATGKVMYFEVQGNSYVLKVNGVTQLTLTDSSITSGYPGITEYTNNISSNGSLDDFSMGDFGGGGTTTSRYPFPSFPQVLLQI